MLRLKNLGFNSITTLHLPWEIAEWIGSDTEMEIFNVDDITELQLPKYHSKLNITLIHKSKYSDQHRTLLFME